MGLDAVESQSKMETKKKATKTKAIYVAAMDDPEAEVKTRILPSGRKATKISKRAVLAHGKTKHVAEETENDTLSLHAKSVDIVMPRQKCVLAKKLDREKLMSPPRPIPSATGHLPHALEMSPLKVHLI